MSDFGQESPLILVVDSDQKVLEKAESVLTSAGFGCRCCSTADEAIATAQTILPDLLICDLNLHGESGMDTCRQIKQYPGLEEVPVMFFSGSQLPDVIRRSHAGGGAYCLRKPFTSEVLTELIDQALGVRGG